ncbi:MULTISPECIES: SDR family oxidoreductase [unclassified Streptomyces]|uniref:SDR family oxidoreductase n=1 Tax=unclassified Streptomyces TaxID=2593676 RepID=UPI002DDC2B5E|nr:SDR family oxidoreductase [Streptomyces sp. NBC_01750]WSB04287.1 SDR family oxidoreductase [Streptomyces sp. NBC_01794]WSD31434.1 SDR family oxidoreductase [Streptomyces sp. NBC_01750]
MAGLDLTGRTAVVTGASRGIGLARAVAATVAVLVSDAASRITGETLVIDGGRLLGDVLPFRQGKGGRCRTAVGPRFPD